MWEEDRGSVEQETNDTNGGSRHRGVDAGLYGRGMGCPGPPTVVSTNPEEVGANPQIDIPGDVNVTIQFSEAMKPRSINNTVYTAAGCGLTCSPTPAPKVPATVIYNSPTHEATIKPTDLPIHGGEGVRGAHPPRRGGVRHRFRG